MTIEKRLTALESKISVTGETVFETQSCRDIQARIKAENKPSKPFNLQEIQKKVSAITL